MSLKSEPLSESSKIIKARKTYEEEEVNELDQSKLQRHAEIRRIINHFVENNTIYCDLLPIFQYPNEFMALLNDINPDFQLSDIQLFISIFQEQISQNNKNIQYWNYLVAKYLKQLPIEFIQNFLLPYCNEHYDIKGVSTIIIELIESRLPSSDAIVPIAFKLSGNGYVSAFIAISYSYPHVLLNTPVHYQRLIEINDPSVLTAIHLVFTPQQILEYGTQQFALDKMVQYKEWEGQGLRFIIVTTNEIGNHDALALPVFQLLQNSSYWIQQYSIRFFFEFIAKLSDEVLVSLVQSNIIVYLFEILQGNPDIQCTKKILTILLYILEKFRENVVEIYNNYTDDLEYFALNSNDEGIEAISNQIINILESYES